MNFPKRGGSGGVQRLFENFPKIHPFWRRQAPLTAKTLAETTFGSTNCNIKCNMILFCKNNGLRSFVTICRENKIIRFSKGKAPSMSNPGALWSLRHLIKVMRRPDLTKKKTMTKTNTKTKTFLGLWACVKFLTLQTAENLNYNHCDLTIKGSPTLRKTV